MGIEQDPFADWIAPRVHGRTTRFPVSVIELKRLALINVRALPESITAVTGMPSTVMRAVAACAPLTVAVITVGLLRGVNTDGAPTSVGDARRQRVIGAEDCGVARGALLAHDKLEKRTCGVAALC